MSSTLAIDILARGGSSAAAEMDKVARAADKTGATLKKNSKISAEAAKASANLTKAHNAETDALDKVQVAEAKLSDVRQVSKTKTSQVQSAEKALLALRNDSGASTAHIAAAEAKLQSLRASANLSTTKVVAGEKTLAKARRDAAVAGDAAQKAAKDLGKILDNEGNKAGKGAAKSVLHWFTGAGKDFEKAGQTAGNGFNSGIMGALKTPVVGPAIIGGLVAAVAAAAVPLGAVVSGAIVTGAGAGLSAIGLKFAAESAVVKSIWSKTATDLGAQMRTISKPFETTLAAMSVVARRTFAALKPQLSAAFKTLAPALTAFGDQLGRSLQKLGPALQPLAGAFSKVLGALGPAMNDLFAKLSASLVKLSESISKNPTALADFTRGIGGLASDLIGFVARLNDADAAFKRLTGGTSAVTALMYTLRGAVATVTGPIDLLTQGFTKLADGFNWYLSHLHDFPGQASAAAASTTTFSSSLFGVTSALTTSANAGLHAAHATHQANAAALLLAGAYDRQAAATQKANQSLMQMSGLLLTLSGSEIAYQQAVDDVTASIKANGRTHDINTQKGRDNQTALNQSAASANAQTINLRNSNKASVAVAIDAQREYAKQAVQMGYTAAEAHRMSLEFVKIPKKVKADFKADITDMTSKVATAKKQLADPHLSATKRAKLQADIVQWQAGIAAAKRSLAGLPADKTAKLLANKADLEAKLKSALAQLKNPSLTATKRAKLEATIANLQAGIKKAKADIASVPGSKTVTITTNIVTKYTTIGSRSSGSGVGGGHQTGVPGRAVGGPVAKGQPYIVGEHRPELFVPDQPGTIIPKVPSMAVGQSIASGMAAGLSGGAGAAVSAAADVALAVIGKTKEVLGISSPSKVFTQLALYVGQGFTKGIHGSTTSIQSAMSALMKKVVGLGFDSAKQGRILRMLQMENKGLQAMAIKRAQVAAQLKAAQAKLAAAIQVRNDFKQAITDAALSFNAITNLQPDQGGQLVAGDILGRMQQTLGATKNFAANLASLKAQGLRTDLYKQIADAGVEAGGATAAALLMGGKGAVAQANSLQAQIASASAGLGNTAAKNMYQAGVDAAQGLVNGLLAKTKALDAASKKLAAAIVAQIKKTLGIRSPSKVLEWHGSMAAIGFSRGIEGEYGRVMKAGAGLGAAAVPARGNKTGAVRSTGGEVRVVLEFKTDGSAHMERLAADVRKYVRATAGGNVQLAFGTGK